jgi:cell division protein FtsQ
MPRVPAATVPRVRALPRPPRAILWAAAVVALIVVGYLTLRDSRFVAVEKVTITGLTGPDAERLRPLLTDAAKDMTTLHVREDQLRTVVEPYAVVKGISFRTDFPHGLRIEVREHVPVAVIAAGNERTPVAADGTLLPGAEPGELPAIGVRVPPGGERLTDRRAMQAVVVLGAAPAPLRARVTGVTFSNSDGLVLDLADGPDLRFGAAARASAKWAAAAAVMADPSSRGAAYLDLRYPERPAAGGLEDPAVQLSPDAANDAAPTGAATATTPATGVQQTAPTPAGP